VSLSMVVPRRQTVLVFVRSWLSIEDDMFVHYYLLPTKKMVELIVISGPYI